MLSRVAVLVYAAIAYVAALASIAYIAGFLQNFGVPKGINDGAPGAFWPSVMVDVGLVWAFGLHHSVTARASFKRVWTRLIPPALERPTYLYMTAAMTWLLVYFWQPVPAPIWNLENAPVYWGIIAAYLAVLAGMFSATFPIGHFAFFGLAQAWQKFSGETAQPTTFTARWLYAAIRHPISLGWMLIPWLTPMMSVGQLCFALATAVYVLAATVFEEADLVAELGNVYRDYRRRVPAFVPFWRHVFPENRIPGSYRPVSRPPADDRSRRGEAFK